MILSPLWGIKGVPDIVAKASFNNFFDSRGIPITSESEKKSLVILELKTGHNLTTEHHTQVTLYTILLADRYQNTQVDDGDNSFPLNSGFLLHLSQERNFKKLSAKITSVSRKRAHLIQILAKRNEMALWIAPQRIRGNARSSSTQDSSKQFDSLRLNTPYHSDITANYTSPSNCDVNLIIKNFLPPVVGNAHGQCLNCYEKEACMIFHRAIDEGTCFTSGLPLDDFDALVGHLTDTHLQYFRQWMAMINIEEENVKGYQRELWTLSGAEREIKGGCISNLRLADSVVDIITPTTREILTKFERFTNSNYDINSFEFVESDMSSPVMNFKAGYVSILDLPFELGDIVSVSLEGAHYGLVRGSISDVTHKTVSIRTSNPVPVPFGTTNDSLSGLKWRIDKDELYSGMRIVKNNLVMLCKNENHISKLRSLLLDLEKPRFVDDLKNSEWNEGSQNKLSNWLRDCVDLPQQLWTGKYTLSDVHSYKKFTELRKSEQGSLEKGLLSECADIKVKETMELNRKHSEMVKAYKLLTIDQRKAVSCVLAAQDYVCIHGMPGTGKTTTISFIVEGLNLLGCSVLICAYTHTAVDNLLLKLKERNLDFYRLGSADSAHPSLHDHVLERTVNTVSKMQKLQYHSSLVVGGTCFAAVKHPLLRKRRFDFCIVDEAGQLIQPVCSGPLCYANRFVLVGDDRQLPPLVKNETAKRMGMDVSLLERLTTAYPDAVSTLLLQFRMHNDIMELANNLTYDNKLRCGAESVAHRSVRYDLKKWPHSSFLMQNSSCEQWLVDVLNPKKAVFFLDTDGILVHGTMERRKGATYDPDNGKKSSVDYSEIVSQSQSSNGGSRLHQHIGPPYDTISRVPTSTNKTGFTPHMGKLENEPEARIVRTLVHGLVHCGVSPEEIGVISPYRSQLRILSNYLSRYGPNLEIQTVDKYQGRDKDVIIVSMVRSNSMREVGGLLRDWRRVNVAFTRAKCKLYVIGSQSTLEASPVFRDFIKIVKDRNWLKSLPLDAHRHFDHIFEFSGKNKRSTTSNCRVSSRELITPADASGFSVSRNICVEANSSYARKDIL